MIRRIVAGLFLIHLATPATQAQFIEKTLELDAYLMARQPIIHSYGKAVLYNNNGTRIYNKQLIYAHQVADENTGSLRFNAQFVSEIGYANSTTGEAPGVLEHCYSARMSAHVNAYNLHVDQYIFFRCIPRPEEIPDIERPDENCPILLDLAQDGFHLSGPDPGVRFDIDADGSPDSIAWTKAGEDEAFLCLDRNGNGVIDDGRELFGYATPLLSGRRARVGYRALADLDRREMGGNGDGRIDAADATFARLCAWVDGDRDGVSQPEEIQSLEETGVVALEYRYKTTQLQDSFGNLFRYVSQAEMRTPSGGVRVWPTFDVIFAAAD